MDCLSKAPIIGERPPRDEREDCAERRALLAMHGGDSKVEGAIEGVVRTGGVDRPRNTSRNLLGVFQTPIVRMPSFLGR